MEWHELPKYNGIQVSQLIYDKACIIENKGADQLRGNRAADQRFVFNTIDSTISLLSYHWLGGRPTATANSRGHV